MPTSHNFHTGTDYNQHWAFAEFVEFPPGSERRASENQLTHSYLYKIESWYGFYGTLEFYEDSGETFFRTFKKNANTDEVTTIANGEYVISKADMLIRSDRFPGWQTSSLAMTDRHVEYLELIYFNDREYYNTELLVAEESHRVYEGIPIWTLQARGHVGRELDAWEIPARDSRQRDPLPDGTELIIVGRTQQQMEVHGTRNYFYLARTPKSRWYYKWISEDFVKLE